MENFDDFLNSLGIETETPASNTIPARTDITPVQGVNEEGTSQETHQLSEQDFDDILQDIGFPIVQEAEIVEEEEDNPEEEEEDIESYNDGWNDRIVAVSTEDELEPQETAVEETPPEQIVPQVPPLIHPNSPTLLIDDSTSRFSGTEWFHEIQKKSILIAGCGGIGSNLAFQLARMAPEKIVLYDNDIVETANMSGQLFSHDDVNQSKVSAISNMIHKYTSTQNVFAIQEPFTSNTEAGDIMMCGFDSMAARELFFASWYNHVLSKPAEERKNCLYIDGRLSIDTLQVFCITGEDDEYMTQYNLKYLFSDSEADDTICSMKQTTYLACMIGSLMTNLFTNWVANSLNPIIPYDLPFFVEYDAQNMIFKTVS